MLSDFDLVKTILGLLSIVGGTASGIAALLVDYRDKATGKITKWGRYAVLGVGTSFLIGASNLWVDYTQKKLEARETANKSREAAQQTLRIVTDISRTLNPLKDVRASYWAVYPFDKPELAQYRERLGKEVQLLMPRLKILERSSGVYISEGDTSGTIKEISIQPNSPLFPDRSKEEFAYTVLAETILTVDFYKTPIDPANLNDLYAPKPDLSMSFDYSNDKQRFLEEAYDPQTKKITLRISNVQSDPKYWNSSGKIVSLLDLPGTQLIIHLGHLRVSGVEDGPECRPTGDGVVTCKIDWSDKRVEPDLTTLVLEVAERRGFWLRREKLKVFKLQDRAPVYVYVFPNTYEGLLQETEAN